MASITYWSQLQPSPYTPSIANGLAAAVRDPAWMLARQWQVAEFEGIDGGSPAYVRIGSHVDRFDAVTLGGKTDALTPGQLLEPVVQAEAPQPDLATRVELGQTFEALLPAAIATRFRAAYPIDPAGPAADPAEARFRAVFAGRVTDGVALYEAAKAAKAAHHGLPSTPSLTAAQRQTALHAINAFIDRVETTWGSFATAEPAAWDPSRLDYSATVAAGELTLSVEPDSESALDWYAFDLTAGTPPTDAAPTTTSVMPGHVRFRGMPNPRWWNFESSATDFGGLLTDSRDLAKLLFADFLLIHGDDWYLARLDVPTGSLCWIDSLTVTDVFGTTADIPAADAPAGTGWTIFTTTDRMSGSNQPCLITPASAAAALQAGPALDELHLLRDETADMAWAVERIAQTGIGAPATLNPLPETTALGDAPAPLVYELQTPLPTNWFPFLPVPGDEELALVAGTIEGSTQAPATLLLQQLSRDGTQIPQHEISRAGLKLQRLVVRTRTPDGGSTLWVARRRHIGAGEASSGLRYDQTQNAADAPAG
jgi:hypothetical protein